MARSGVPALEAGLAAEGLAPRDITHVLLTDIHLDHAGGTGSLLEENPRIAVYVRPKGRLGGLYMRLIDPFRRAVVYPGLLAAGRRAALRVGAGGG